MLPTLSVCNKTNLQQVAQSKVCPEASVAKNIVIFSDGTGQRGGVLVDENRSNIYKLYRATRCGPESSVNPTDQLAFYDPGIGTLPHGAGLFGTLWRRFYNMVSQALGLGLTGNMIDCYAAIVRLWRPGDNIFLFGFSRGAYTVRCLGGVIGMCGVPTQSKGGGPLLLDEDTTKHIASEAVKEVYQHTSSWDPEKATVRQKELLEQRRELARRFRRTYASGNDEGPDVNPYFIGVFDTVASLSNPAFLALLIALALGAILLLSTALWYMFNPIWVLTSWWHWALALSFLVGAGGLAANLWMRVKWEKGLPHSKGFHLAEARMNFYDTQLNPKVAYARHALSIDETRDEFRRVRWGNPKFWRDTGLNRAGGDNPRWFEQLWFTGNHSDIGGSYEENESRLSDISLRWMLEAAARVGLKFDPAAIYTYPDPTGPQHDETISSPLFNRTSKSLRRIGPNFPLHESVIARFQAPAVLHYNVMKPYRPENLREHEKVKGFYA